MVCAIYAAVPFKFNDGRFTLGRREKLIREDGGQHPQYTTSYKFFLTGDQVENNISESASIHHSVHC